MIVLLLESAPLGPSHQNRPQIDRKPIVRIRSRLAADGEKQSVNELLKRPEAAESM
jgi:hypothetical protein